MCMEINMGAHAKVKKWRMKAAPEVGPNAGAVGLISYPSERNKWIVEKTGSEFDTMLIIVPARFLGQGI